MKKNPHSTNPHNMHGGKARQDLRDIDPKTEHVSPLINPGIPQPILNVSNYTNKAFNTIMGDNDLIELVDDDQIASEISKNHPRFPTTDLRKGKHLVANNGDNFLYEIEVIKGGSSVNGKMNMRPLIYVGIGPANLQGKFFEIVDSEIVVGNPIKVRNGKQEFELPSFEKATLHDEQQNILLTEDAA